MLGGDPPNYKALSKYHSSSQMPRSAGTKNVLFTWTINDPPKQQGPSGWLKCDKCLTAASGQSIP